MEELTTAEIATRIGKDKRTVQRWLKSGKLPSLPWQAIGTASTNQTWSTWLARSM